ncbi:stAR-related lipid transfer protein 7, mitochondrial isoform X2 [Aricia agestis]|uniref:stAR-related lipid transfer protein 7, mitochondrial isoform X2 n=1 Tax=Aricia agestis TaxID=91739 RepID=UPI001C206C26|nr:stAR-related lipid transfer protein 7, mitochondrial isoform X2 [Aricia agestis]
MSTVRLKFLFKELRFLRLWNVWTRRSGVNTVRRYLRERSVRDVIQCFKYTILRPRRTLLLSAAAYKFNDDSGQSCKQGISDEELQSLLLELDNVQQLAKLTLYCTCCGNRIMIDRKQEGVQYCGCKEPKPAEDSSDGWFPYMETDDVIIWRKEYKPGKGLYAYKVYGRYPEVLASDYAAVQLDGAYRRVWDSAVAALAVVERDARGVTGQTVLHWEVLWPRLFANRDYVYIRRHAELELSRDRVFVILSRSCDHPDVPETKHAIRVTEYWSHMVVKALTDESGTEFVLTYYDEPATGGMPCGVAAWASSRAAPVYLARMRRAALAYRRWAADEAQDLPDFIPLSPDQVNRDRHMAVEEQDMETSKQGPDMDNGKTTQDQSTQTENVEEKEKVNSNGDSDKDREVKDTEREPRKEINGVNDNKKSASHEEGDKSEESENNGWWRYLYPFYYFV